MKLEFHHINYVSKDVDELDDFYRNILQMESLSPQNFPRTDATDSSGYAGKIRFATEGTMQMHLAEQDLTVAAKHSQHINPVERGHIAFRTDDIEAFKALLQENDIDFADYGTAFAEEWYQIFFHDPVGNIIEVHQMIDEA
tara:strand:+ start:303 stop:725 length:423 start_codon:yes stop_codon:yes gene_type:complete